MITSCLRAAVNNIGWLGEEYVVCIYVSTKCVVYMWVSEPHHKRDIRNMLDSFDGIKNAACISNGFAALWRQFKRSPTRNQKEVTMEKRARSKIEAKYQKRNTHYTWKSLTAARTQYIYIHIYDANSNSNRRHQRQWHTKQYQRATLR